MNRFNAALAGIAAMLAASSGRAATAENVSFVDSVRAALYAPACPEGSSLEPAWGAGLALVQGAGALRPPSPPPGSVLGAGFAVGEDAAGGTLFRAEGWSEFPPADDATRAALASRVPGLDVRNMRTVPQDVAVQSMQRAADARATYLDILTQPAFRRGRAEVYLVPQDVLASVDRRYVSGTLPVAGTTKDGKPFRMQAMTAGGGAVHFLYDQPGGFSFMEGPNEIKIGNGGDVAVRLEGPSDISIQGLQGCGCIAVFCGCAELQRITLASPGKVSLQTSRGTHQADIQPIRTR